mgnify:CR=1 FL=1
MCNSLLSGRFAAGIRILYNLKSFISPLFNLPEIVNEIKSKLPVVLTLEVLIVVKLYKFELVPVNEQDATPEISEYRLTGQNRADIFPPSAVTFGSQE